MQDVLAKNTPPLYQGTSGKFWQYDSEAVQQKTNPDKQILPQTAFIVYAPYAHPFWHSYLLGCMSLAKFEGWPESVIRLPGATHELVLMALHPDEPIMLNEPVHVLHPANFVSQFIADSDEAAGALIRSTAEDVANGILNPDTDFAQQWIKRFGDNSIKGWTAQPTTLQ